MGDLAWFENRRAILLDGVILEQGPIDPPHAVALGLVLHALQSVFAAGWWVRVQSPLHFDTYNDPLPDFPVVSGQPRDYAGRLPTAAALVVEVSDTTLDTDVTEKAERYATAGIADYWVLDLNGGRRHVFRDPVPLPAGLGATAYRTRLTLGSSEAAVPLAAPNATVRVADQLP
jgi:Uma2 family endonuclease